MNQVFFFLAFCLLCALGAKGIETYPRVIDRISGRLF